MISNLWTKGGFSKKKSPKIEWKFLKQKLLHLKRWTMNSRKLSTSDLLPLSEMKRALKWASKLKGRRGKTFWEPLRQYLSGRTWNLSQLQQHFLFSLISTHFEDNLYHTLPTVSFSCADIMYWGSSGSLVSFDWSGILLLKK